MISTFINITRSPKYQSWVKLGITFLTGQGILQALQLITGILIVRTMPMEQYAQYTLAFAMQSTALMLVEGGFAGSIIDLVGSRVNNKEVVGNYVKAAAFYRTRLLWIVGILFSVVFFFITERYEWDWHVRLLLLLSILLSLVFSAYISLYKPVLQIARNFSLIYRTEIYQALLRLFLVVILFLSIGLIAWQLALLSAFVLIFRGISLRESAAKFLLEPEVVPSETKLEMFRYVKPLFPGIVFTAFQGQILVIMISFLGNTESVAQVGALGRLSQIFTFFSAIAGMVLSPYFARQSNDRLLRKYIHIAIATALLVLLFPYLAFLFPNLILSILGSNYQNLSQELLIMVGSASVSLLNTILWIMNKSRKWLYSRVVFLNIFGTLTIQLVFIVSGNIQNVKEILLMGLAINLYILFLRFVTCLIGFKSLTTDDKAAV